MSGLVVLDIGILMGSRSPQVFMEQIELYPGARRILDGILQGKCECNDPMCSQRCFQTLITMDGEATAEESAKFIDFLNEKETLTWENLRQLQQEFYHEHLVPRLNQEYTQPSIIMLDGFDKYTGDTNLTSPDGFGSGPIKLR